MNKGQLNLKFVFNQFITDAPQSRMIIVTKIKINNWKKMTTQRTIGAHSVL